LRAQEINGRVEFWRIPESATPTRVKMFSGMAPGAAGATLGSSRTKRRVSNILLFWVA
jgi:hypothetical protein